MYVISRDVRNVHIQYSKVFKYNQEQIFHNHKHLIVLLCFLNHIFILFLFIMLVRDGKDLSLFLIYDLVIVSYILMNLLYFNLLSLIYKVLLLSMKFEIYLIDIMDF